MGESMKLMVSWPKGTLGTSLSDTKSDRDKGGVVNVIVIVIVIVTDLIVIVILRTPIIHY